MSEFQFPAGANLALQAGDFLGESALCDWWFERPGDNTNPIIRDGQFIYVPGGPLIIDVVNNGGTDETLKIEEDDTLGRPVDLLTIGITTPTRTLTILAGASLRVAYSFTRKYMSLRWSGAPSDLAGTYSAVGIVKRGPIGMKFAPVGHGWGGP